MLDSEVSIRAKILRELIARFSFLNTARHKFKGGEQRKKIAESAWKCPTGYHLTCLENDNFSMEFLQAEKNPRHLAVLQLHGGGYVGAMTNAHRSTGVLYSQMGKGAAVLTIDYRVAPENPYPAALEDALYAYEWLLMQGYKEEEIILGGDSAGGGLAMALCLYLRDHGRKLPKGIIAMSPWADLTASGASYVENFELDPLFGKSKDSLIYDSDYIGNDDPKNPYISPVFGDFTGFPPMLIQVGSIEMLLSDSLTVEKKAKAQGVKVKLSVYQGMFHVFQRAMLLMPESKKAWLEVEKFIEELLEM